MSDIFIRLSRFVTGELSNISQLRGTGVKLAAPQNDEEGNVHRFRDEIAAAPHRTRCQ